MLHICPFAVARCTITQELGASDMLSLKANIMCSFAAMTKASGDTFYLDSFASRQWDDPNYAGTRIDFDKAEFVAKVHKYYHDGSGLVDGYAPFCKHVFVPNFIGAKVGSVPITVENKSSILTAYESRRPEELPVLARCECVHCRSAPIEEDVHIFSGPGATANRTCGVFIRYPPG
jgi:hypothetical protein